MKILNLLKTFVLVQVFMIVLKKLAAHRANLIKRKEELKEFKGVYIGYVSNISYALALTYCNSIDMIVSNFSREIYYVCLNLILFIFLMPAWYLHDCFMEDIHDIISFGENILISTLMLIPAFLAFIIVS